ncbi:MAG: antitoxin family protein [Bryobacteraceae bacterium]|jgi:predicted DNA-binding antitoxin AbrB/MazE fold protein
MSIPARYENGVFRPLEEVKGAASGEVYRVFSEEELHGLRDGLAWLKAAERSFEFWDKEEDAVYDNV